jgi:Tfp pilus assembly protein PilZ
LPRKLRIEYRTEDAFRREYAQNIAKGGIFIPTKYQLELRDAVEIELVLAFLDQSVVLPGEVVHCIPPEMAATGAAPGVAIQFSIAAEEVRSKLEPFAGSGAVADERAQGTGRREAPRSRARVFAQVELDGTWVDGITRNVSSSGALIAVPGEPPAVGRRLKVRINHPTNDEQMIIPGVIARHVESAGTTCLGIQFHVPEARHAAVSEFVNRVRAVEHNRRLGGINGPIEDLGIRSVLGMFARAAPEGMLTLTRGAEEGYITIRRGRLRARLGPLTGRAALDAMLAWSDGSFEFEARADDALVDGDAVGVDEVSGSSSGSQVGSDEEELLLIDLDELAAPVVSSPARAAAIGPGGRPIEDDDSIGSFALDDAQIRLESRMQVDAAPITATAVLGLGREQDRSGLGKVEEALLDLAAVGMTVAKAIEIIPESEAQVYAALRTLVDEGFLELS